ncbi:hypothetical protein SNEBB_000228 [Seison nebaliae]|nr:hypothetical protein SNEBB_000228 [Seison nebaliae]
MLRKRSPNFIFGSTNKTVILDTVREKLRYLTKKLHAEYEFTDDIPNTIAIEEEIKTLKNFLNEVKVDKKKLVDNKEVVEDLVKKEVEKHKESINESNDNMDNHRNTNNNNNGNDSGIRRNYHNRYISNSMTRSNQENLNQKINRLSMAQQKKDYQDLLALQSNIYINGTSYHYELKLVPNNISLSQDNRDVGKFRNITLKNDWNDNRFDDDLQNRFITKNYLVNYQKNETGKIIQKIANDFIKNTEQMHNYKTFYPRMPLHRYSRVAYGNRDEKIMLRTMDLEESNEIREKLNTDYLARQTIADYD